VTGVLSQAVQLTRDLVRVDTAGPIGNESRAVDVLANRLAPIAACARFAVEPGRDNLVARLPASASVDDELPALCLSGHLDTVPYVAADWTYDPLGARVADGRIWGRGAADMKAGVAALVVAFERLARQRRPRPIVLALTASEETGCQGAAVIADQLGPVDALVIAEPTANRIALGHKGAFWASLHCFGISAHASMPELGDNAIYKMSDVIAGLRVASERLPVDDTFGRATLCVGTIQGGVASNVIPDKCAATVDIRLVPGFTPEAAAQTVRASLPNGAGMMIDISLPAVSSEPEDPWLAEALAEGRRRLGHEQTEGIVMSYFTDASVLSPALGDPAVIVVGPGEPSQAHQVDEWCSIDALDAATGFYEHLGRVAVDQRNPRNQAAA
jgi:succinyl-diaminopimelate desuccinylase